MKVTAMEEYGLRCLVHLAHAHAEKHSLTIPEIASAEDLSSPYVGKIMATLRSGGLVSSVRGRSGGYTLSRNPRAITLDEALTVLGGRLFTSAYCDRYHSSKSSDCVHNENCSLRPVWGSIEMIVGGVLRRMSLADLAESEESMRSSLSQAMKDSLKDNLERTPALSST